MPNTSSYKIPNLSNFKTKFQPQSAVLNSEIIDIYCSCYIFQSLAFNFDFNSVVDNEFLFNRKQLRPIAIVSDFLWFVRICISIWLIRFCHVWCLKKCFCVCYGVSWHVNKRRSHRSIEHLNHSFIFLNLPLNFVVCLFIFLSALIILNHFINY